jgi:uncharacterized protein (DUF58 family)
MSEGWIQRVFGWGRRRASAAGASVDSVDGVEPTAGGGAVVGGVGGVGPWMDVPALMAIHSLELRVRRLVEGLSRGIHRSVRRGYSTEFTEYRPYTPGDDLRHMDWRRLARTDRPYVRQYEEESEWGCLVVMDLSASMALGTPSKADYGRTLAGTLGMFLHNQGDPVGLLRFSVDPGEVVPVRHGPRQLARWWSLLAAEPAGRGTGLAKAMDGALRLLKRPGLVVVVSDLLTDPASWAEPLRLLRAARHEVVFFEVLDAQELEFPFGGDTRFENLEEPRAMDVDAGRAREAYLQRLAEHRTAVRAQCARESAPLLCARTDKPLEPVLRAALGEIERLRPLSGTRHNLGGRG